MAAYYNENDPFCAGWLRNLAAAGHIAPGDVDDRDIRDVSPDDLRGYDQCHFFAGIGLWSQALRWAGWPDDRPVWTGSCPCQPFSAAGRGAGFADERHLWPAWEWLIGVRRPVAIIGEQVGSPAGLLWLDVVSAGLEGMGYTIGAVDVPSAGVGAPNIRQRLWWVADTKHTIRGPLGVDRQEGRDRAHAGRQEAHSVPGARGEIRAGGVADTEVEQRPADGVERGAETGPDRGTLGGIDRQVGADRSPGGLVDAKSRGRGEYGVLGETVGERQDTGQPALADETAGDGGLPLRPQHASAGMVSDPWRVLEWIDCLDGRKRPAQPGVFPLAARHPGDVARLRAYGNAINPVVAAHVIRAFMDII